MRMRFHFSLDEDLDTFCKQLFSEDSSRGARHGCPSADTAPMKHSQKRQRVRTLEFVHASSATLAFM